uniref:WGS project CBMI000000000 data, contig CS3069_c001949 n=1 Tax=Fusarium clavum TaxID=2594811 RepID=A0A090MC75_9HYPO|nr:unnamed protein product [Fusarium clavum]CEG05824.1 unnamed protein product [Fusarium clavum]
MAPSQLYSQLYELARRHGEGDDILSIRSPDAKHAWGHNRLVSLNPTLQNVMDNEAFATHLKTTGRLLAGFNSKIHEITVDEYQRMATIRMSYYLSTLISDEVVENDLIWTLKFTKQGEVKGDPNGVLIKESIEFVDATANARLGALLRDAQVEIGKDVKGGLGIILD